MLLLTTEEVDMNGMTGSGGELYMFEISESSLNLIFKCSDVAEKPSILPNQIRKEHQNLLSRVFTDLSIDISTTSVFGPESSGGPSQPNDIEQNSVREVHLWYPEAIDDLRRPILIIILADFSVNLYQGITFGEDSPSKERFRFKLVDSHVLIKPRCAPDFSYSRQIVHLEGKMALILHPMKNFGIFIRNGRPVLVDIGKQQSPTLASLAPFKGAYWAINDENLSVKAVRFATRFDPRAPSLKLSDGYLLK